MQKFHFTLEKVLNLKRQTLDVLKSEMMVLHDQLAKIEREIVENEQRFQERNDEMRERLRTGLSSLDIISYKQYFNALNNQSRVLLQKRSQQQIRVQGKERELLAMKSDISGLEKLMEKQHAEYAYASQKIAERDLEEYISQKAFRA